MALDIKRTRDGGLVLCAPVCVNLAPADVALARREARAMHADFHRGVAGDEIGTYFSRRGGHYEIVGDPSNREFLRERAHMGGFYQETDEAGEVSRRFPSDVGDLARAPRRRVARRRRRWWG